MWLFDRYVNKFIRTIHPYYHYLLEGHSDMVSRTRLLWSLSVSPLGSSLIFSALRVQTESNPVYVMFMNVPLRRLVLIFFISVDKLVSLTRWFTRGFSLTALNSCDMSFCFDFSFIWSMMLWWVFKVLVFPKLFGSGEWKSSLLILLLKLWGISRVLWLIKLVWSWTMVIWHC